MKDELASPPARVVEWHVEGGGRSVVGRGQTAWQAWKDAALVDDEGVLLPFHEVKVTQEEKMAEKKKRGKVVQIAACPVAGLYALTENGDIFHLPSGQVGARRWVELVPITPENIYR